MAAKKAMTIAGTSASPPRTRRESLQRPYDTGLSQLQATQRIFDHVNAVHAKMAYR